MTRFLILVVTTMNMLVTGAFADTLTIGAGAGYKRMVGEIIQAYENKAGQKVDAIFGDMKEVMTQAKTSRNVAMVLGEQNFLKNPEFGFTSFSKLGRGILVLAFGKNVKLTKPEDLIATGITRVGVASPNKTIYGKAAHEFLETSGLYKQIEKKIVLMPTCPKIMASLTGGEIQAGFVNLTEAIYLQDKIGGYVVVDESKYEPINLVFGVFKGFENHPETVQFLKFLESDPEVKNIIKKSGL
ncbi:MAG: molybdate ABC transporter substrate-binding protein [Desulfomonilaceae bacterium]